MKIISRYAFTLAAVAGAFLVPGALQAQAQEQGPDSVVLAHGSRGAVTFAHGKHAKATECVSCHHESKPEKALSKEHQSCADCHTTPATEPMKTTLRMAMHNTAEKTGTCMGCHTKAAAEGKTVPQSCSDCHVKKEGAPGQ